MKINNILEYIGSTPHVRINNLFPPDREVWLKLEKFNPGGSIKDRIALAMVEDAEQKGILKRNSVIIEPTSGNTGVGLAMVCAVKGYELILVMPESMSVERRRIMSAYAAKFVLTARENGMRGAIKKAQEMLEEIPNSWMPQQFENFANPEIHKKTTAVEILNDFPEGIDYLIAGMGTGGHLTACAEILKEKFPSLKVFAFEPALSPVLSGGEPGPHPIQGIGPGFVPIIFNRDLIDGVLTITKENAFKYARLSASEEGVFGGISTGAALAAIAAKMPEIPVGARVLGFNYDAGERYLSLEDLFIVKD